MLSQITYPAGEPHEAARPIPPRGTAAGRVVLFTNVDRALLNDHYKGDIPRRLLERSLRSFDVVFVSGRTLSELFALQASLACPAECIAENGGVAATYTPLRDGAVPEWEVGGPGLLAVQCLASPISETLALLRNLAAKHKVPLRVLSDYSRDDLARCQRQTPVEAERALARRSSVLVDARVISHPAGATFLSRVRRSGCTVQRDGDWISVVRGASVGATVRQYLVALSRRGDAVAYTVGIGDATEDASWLRAMDHPFVVPRPDIGYTFPLARIPHATRLTQSGSAGWVEMMEQLPRTGHDAS